MTTNLTTGSRARHSWQPAVSIVAALVGAWVVTWAANGADHVPPHLFYLPILLAATWCGPWSVALASLVATLAAGPLLPADVANGSSQLTSDWVIRGVFFLTLGQLMGALVRSLRAAEDREQTISDREVAIAVQKASILQGLAHELRTPLAILAGTSQLLADPALGDRDRMNLWPAHRRALQRLETIVEVAVVLSDDDRSPVDGTFQVGSVVKHHAGAISRGDVARVVLIEGSQEWATADVPLVGLLLRLLIDNALRFSADGEAVEVSAHRDGDRIRIQIDDRGPGLEPDEWARLTNTFVQGRILPATVSGLGLGLSAASRIVDLLGTDLTFAARPGGGTGVSFTLPSAEAPSVDSARASSSPQSLQVSAEAW